MDVHGAFRRLRWEGSALGCGHRTRDSSTQVNRTEEHAKCYVANHEEHQMRYIDDTSLLTSVYRHLACLSPKPLFTLP